MGVRYSQFMKRGGWLAALAALTVGLGLAAAACGSGGAPEDQDGEPASTGTVRSEREARQASIMQQQGQSGESATAAGQDGQDERDEQIDVSSEDEPLAGVTELGSIDFGHREGLPYLRNSVGDPEAPVVIVEYSDFQ